MRYLHAFVLSRCVVELDGDVWGNPCLAEVQLHKTFPECLDRNVVSLFALVAADKDQRWAAVDKGADNMRF